MSILDETGKPVPQADGDSTEKPEQEQPGEVVPQILVTLKGESVTVSPNTPDLRLVLRMLHEAADIMLVNLAQAQTLSRLARAQAGIQKPSLRDVLAVKR